MHHPFHPRVHVAPTASRSDPPVGATDLRRQGAVDLADMVEGPGWAKGVGVARPLLSSTATGRVLSPPFRTMAWVRHHWHLRRDGPVRVRVGKHDYIHVSTHAACTAKSSHSPRRGTGKERKAPKKDGKKEGAAVHPLPLSAAGCDYYPGAVIGYHRWPACDRSLVGPGLAIDVSHPRNCPPDLDGFIPITQNFIPILPLTKNSASAICAWWARE